MCVQATAVAGQFTIAFQFALGTTALPLTASFAGLGTPANATLVATAPTLTKRWFFAPSASQMDTVQTFTAEKGTLGQANFGVQVPFVTIPQLNFKISPEATSVDGNMLGQILTDPFTLTTADVTEIPVLPVDPASFAVYCGTDPGLLSRLSREFEFDLDSSARFKPVITLDDSMPSFSSLVEGEPDPKVKLTVEHDANGLAMRAAMRAGTRQVLRLEAKGALIEPGFPNRVCFQMPVKWTECTDVDKDGVKCLDFSGTVLRGRDLDGWLYAEIDNQLAAL